MKTIAAKYLFLIFFALLPAIISLAQPVNRPDELKWQKDIILSLDIPTSDNSAIHQSLYYQIPFRTKADVHIQCYQLRDGDSIKLYDILFNRLSFKKGVHRQVLNFQKNSKQVYANYEFYDVLKKFEIIPPGAYMIHLDINFPDSNRSIQKSYYRLVDSTLAHYSSLRKDINSEVAGKSKNISGSVKSSSRLSGKSKAASIKETQSYSSKLNRKVTRSKGVTSVPEIREDKSFTALYYQRWFLGRYEVTEQKAMKAEALKEKYKMKTDPSSFVNTDIENFTPVSSQVRQLNKKEEKDKKFSGSIDYLNAFGTSQEPGSRQDNNYQEFMGSVNTKIMNLPVIIEGLYTTQDQGRNAKASYIRVRYDMEAAKGELGNTISSYKNKYGEASSKGMVLSSSYNGLISKLGKEKGSLLREFEKEYGVDGKMLERYNGDIDKMLPALDTAKLVNKARQYGERKVADNDEEKTGRNNKVKANKADIKKRYGQIIATQKKIDKYKSLLEQYNEQMHLDSALNLAKINKLEGKDVSYKAMTKAAADFLPEGKVSKFVSGLTKLDIGILNQYESNYTMAGQNLKGGTVGYDLGFVKTSFALGKTEYVSRDGNVDRYNSYMARLDFKPVRQQTTGLIYYSISPTRQIIEDSKFFKSDIGIPTFVQPVHVISLLHEGKIGKDLNLKTEAAVSSKKFEGPSPVKKDNTALLTTLEYTVPIAPASLKAEWEHMGSRFENNGLPYTMAGTERYTLAAEASVFRSLISAGVQYNLLKQTTFSSTGYNRKWGFDLKTHFRRYPNLFLSYKPFTTFRTFSDTLNINQRPMIGEVWIAKGSYQLKRQRTVHRFIAIYNRNSSSMDTQSYRTTTIQGGYTNISKTYMISANLGWMQLPAYDSTGFSKGNNYFINGAFSRKIGKQFSASVAQDVAFAGYGLQRLAITLGLEYSFVKLPIAIRVMGRYANAKLSEQAVKTNLWAGQAGINWRFKMEKNK